MAVGSVRQGTVSSEISEIAAGLLARERVPIQTLENRRSELNSRSSVLATLRTRLLALRSTLDTLAGAGTLSPFAAKAATASDTATLGASATASATSSVLSVTVGALARRATHVSDRLADTGATIATGGAGTFTFSVTVAGVTYASSVTVGAADDDKTVLDNVAAAITAAAAGKVSAVRVQTESGASRLSVASATSGTTNKLTFTDSDGLLARLGLVRGTPTAATDSTGGYVYEDLGNHELDARLVVDGLTYYRDSNTVTDLVEGVTLSLKAVSSSPVTVKVQVDTEHALDKIREFIGRYNEVLDHLAQHTAIDAKRGTRGVLALEPVYADLPSQLRLRLAARVGSQAAGTPDTLSVLGIKAGQDGRLSIADEAALRDRLAASPEAVAALFNATDGVATTLESFVDGYANSVGQIALTQNQLTLRIGNISAQITRANAVLARKQTQLEQQLARHQALLQQLARQANQVTSFFGMTIQ